MKIRLSNSSGTIEVEGTSDKRGSAAENARNAFDVLVEKYGHIILGGQHFNGPRSPEGKRPFVDREAEGKKNAEEKPR